MKESIFSYLNQEVEGARILDLFSGTGSLGIEALSRGAGSVVFVERDSLHIRILKENLERCGFAEDARILQGDVFRKLVRLGEAGERFDIILADPPFRQMLRNRIAECVDRSGVLAKEGLLLIEHEVHDDDPVNLSMRLIKKRQFGQCVVSIYA